MVNELVTWLIGGGLLTLVGTTSSIVTLKYNKKSAEADAMKKMQEVYQEMIEDLRKDKLASRGEVVEVKQKLDEVSRDVEENKRLYAELKPYKCTDLKCLSRKQ